MAREDLGVRATDLAEAGPEDVVELLGPFRYEEGAGFDLTRRT